MFRDEGVLDVTTLEEFPETGEHLTSDLGLRKQKGEPEGVLLEVVCGYSREREGPRMVLLVDHGVYCQHLQVSTQDFSTFLGFQKVLLQMSSVKYTE
jgi:hypothetical protein